MLSILVHYNQILRAKYNNDLKRIPVPTIDSETYQFRRRQDTIHRFITEMIVVSPASEPISLNTIANRYQEWYARSIKAQAPSTTEVVAQLENSYLAKYLERRNASVLFLIGHRLKITLEDTLSDNERDLSPVVENCAQHVNNDISESSVSTIANDNIANDNFMNDICKTAQSDIYVQTREQKPPCEQTFDIDQIIKQLSSIVD
jgi:hypothetical protein